MIYVLSASRLDTMKWARAEGLTLAQVRHVQSAGSLPGVLNPKKTRIVKLPSYAKRYDRFALNARLKQIDRKGKIKIEEPGVVQENFQVVPELSTEALVKMAIEQNAEFDMSFDEGGFLPAGETQVTNDSDEPEIVVTQVVDAEDFLAKVGKAQSEIAKIYDAETVSSEQVEKTLTGSADESDHNSATQTFLPNDPADKATEPVDFLKRAEEDAVALEEIAEPVEKPKRVRRTNVQIAYDKALVDWESNGGTVEAVKAARADLKDGDERLEGADPTEPDDLDF